MLLTGRAGAAPAPDPESDLGLEHKPGSESGRVSAPDPVPARLDADEATTIALLNCLVREVAVPGGLAETGDGHLFVRLPCTGIRLRARLTRASYGPSLRLRAPVEEQPIEERPVEAPAAEEKATGGQQAAGEQAAGERAAGGQRMGSGWVTLGCARLAELVAQELSAATGRANPEFIGQVADGHAALAAILAARPRAGDLPGPAFVAAEQSLVAGHRFHPSPKARQGSPGCWLAYAPEVGARFALHWLAVRTELVAEEGDRTEFAALEALGPRVADGYRPLPAHPWQLSLLRERPAVRRALDRRDIVDLGAVGPQAVPTSSVRTVYLPEGDLFGKFSLDVRITNCVRKNAWYELSGAVLLNRLLQRIITGLGEAFGGCVLLPEPAYRTVALADRQAYEGLAVILRGGVNGSGVRGTGVRGASADGTDPGGTGQGGAGQGGAGQGGTSADGMGQGGTGGVPVLAAALADPYGCSPWALVRLLAGSSPDQAADWWDRYVRLVVPPVLHAYLAHGVVLEPHLQNVLAVLDETDGMPRQVIFRDLEGTKLVGEVWGDRLRAAGPAAKVLDALSYDADRGWKRVVYCLFVNHLAEVAAAIADLHLRLEPVLWRALHGHVLRYAAEHGTSGDHRLTPSGAHRLTALLSGEPFPAKANLLARWSRAADRQAHYVTVHNPFAHLDTRITKPPTPSP